jgi:hypothetical protein
VLTGDEAKADDKKEEAGKAADRGKSAEPVKPAPKGEATAKPPGEASAPGDEKVAGGPPAKDAATDADAAANRLAARGGAFACVLALLGAAGTVARALRAFRVDPAKLMASVAAGARVSDLEDQTSFRFKFSREFAEVIQALDQSASYKDLLVRIIYTSGRDLVPLASDLLTEHASDIESYWHKYANLCGTARVTE